MMNEIYLDNAATTKVFAEEFDLMKGYNDTLFYNPSAAYFSARKVNNEFEKARTDIQNLIKGDSGKLFFTASATESNNTIFQGAHLRAGDEVLISAGEHPSVYESAYRLEKKGIVVNEIPLTKEGVVDAKQFELMLKPTVKLISIIHVSNETGAINDIKNLCATAKTKLGKVIFHSDGVQAFGKIKINLKDLGVDLYTISGHKVYAPRGIAGLWVKTNTLIDPLLVGGGQEFGFRSSTENVLGALAFSYSAKRVYAQLEDNYKKVEFYKNEFLNCLQSSEIAGYLRVNSSQNSSPYILSISFVGLKGEVLMNALQTEGIMVSTGSACSSKKAGNKTLSAMGVNFDSIVGSMRISFSPYTEYDIQEICKIFERVVLRFLKTINIKK